MIVLSMPRRATILSARFALMTKKNIPLTCMITKSDKLPPIVTVMTVGAPNTNIRRPPSVNAWLSE